MEIVACSWLAWGILFLLVMGAFSGIFYIKRLILYLCPTPSEKGTRYSLEVRKSNREEMYSGHVWVPSNIAEAKHGRNIVMLRYNKKKVYAEASVLDKNFMSNYFKKGYRDKKCNNIEPTRPMIVMSKHYRAKLAISEDACFPKCNAIKKCSKCKQYPAEKLDIELFFFNESNWLANCRACLDHPMVSVRLGTYLGIISLLLGLISFIVALVSSGVISAIKDLIIIIQYQW